MAREEIEQAIKEKKERRDAYLAREKEMLTNGVQSYGVGTRNLTRYNTDLSTVRKAIKELEDEIKDLEALLAGKKRRRAVGVVPRDW